MGFQRDGPASSGASAWPSPTGGGGLLPGIGAPWRVAKIPLSGRRPSEHSNVLLQRRLPPGQCIVRRSRAPRCTPSRNQSTGLLFCARLRPQPPPRRPTTTGCRRASDGSTLRRRSDPRSAPTLSGSGKIQHPGSSGDEPDDKTSIPAASSVTDYIRGAVDLVLIEEYSTAPAASGDGSIEADAT
jgi:hypothetical protein